MNRAARITQLRFDRNQRQPILADHLDYQVDARAAMGPDLSSEPSN